MTDIQPDSSSKQKSAAEPPGTQLSMAEHASIPDPNSSETAEAEEGAHLARHSEHNSRLQTWIGSYGAGLASLLVYQFRTAVADTKDSWKAHTSNAASAKLDAIVGQMHADLRAALAVVAMALALQVVLLFINKATQAALANPDKEGTIAEWWYAQSCNISLRYSIDVACDTGSIVLLAYATIRGLNALRILI